MPHFSGREMTKILCRPDAAIKLAFIILISTATTVALASNTRRSPNEFPLKLAEAKPQVQPCRNSNFTPEDIFQQAKQSVALIVVEGVGSGSGFVIGNRGGHTQLITNSHVLGGRHTASVQWIDGTSEQAILLKDGKGSADINDVALLEIKNYTRPILMIKNTPPNIGAQLVAIGSPGAGDQTLDFSLTSGVLSNLYANNAILQFDTPINPGNSGGPIFDRSGCVVGVATFKVVENSVEGLGFGLSGKRIIEFLAYDITADYSSNNLLGSQFDKSQKETAAPNEQNPATAPSISSKDSGDMHSDSQRFPLIFIILIPGLAVLAGLVIRLSSDEEE